MKRILEHAGNRTLVMIVLMLVGAVSSGAARAQQAPGSEQAAPTDSAPMPVTPFGPRRRLPATMSASAQPGAQQQSALQLPKPEVVAEHGAWRVLCEKLRLATRDNGVEEKKVCYVSAGAQDPKRKGVFVILNILAVRDDKGKVVGHMVNLRAPLGVFLPTGIALEVDGEAVTRVPFSRCNQLFCESTGQARKETLAKLKKGKKARFIIYARPGVGLPVELDLKGFSAAMKELASLK